MGFRSTFVSEDYSVKWPSWFVTHYSPIVHFKADCIGVISSKTECKTYYPGFQNLAKDIQTALNEQNFFNRDDNFVFVYLHECGGITRVQIEKDAIYYSEPTDFESVKNVTHDYCYGCSDFKNIDKTVIPLEFKKE